MLLLSTFLYSAGAAVAAFMALEAYLAVAAADGTYPSALLALVAAAGQITGKLLWYWAGAGTTRLPWLRRKLESPKAAAAMTRWRDRTDGRPVYMGVVLLVSVRRLCNRAILEQHPELITAEACNRVRHANPRLQQPGDIPEEAVAGLMAARVVDNLELVEVDVQQCVGALASLRSRHCDMQAVVEFAPVDEAGERIVACLVGERALQAPFFGHVVEYDDRTDDLALPVADRRGGFLDGDLLRRAGHEHCLVARAPRFTATENSEQWIGDGLARHLVDEVQHLADRAAPRLGAVPPGKTLRDRVHVFDMPLRIGADHRIADGLQRDLGALFLGKHGLLGALAFGDVDERAFIAADLAVHITDGAGVLQDGDRLSVAPPDLELRIAHFAHRFDSPDELDAIVLVPVDERCARKCVDLFGTVVTEQAHQGGIHREEAPVAAALIDTFGDAFEQSAVLGFAAAQRFFRQPPLDGDAGKLCSVRHAFGFRGGRQPRLLAIHAQCSQHFPARCGDGHGPCRAQACFLSHLPALLPEGILDQVGDQHLPAQVNGRGAGSVANVDSRTGQHGPQSLGHPRRDHLREAAATFRKNTDGSKGITTHGLDEASDGFEHRRERRIDGQLLEYLPLGSRDTVRMPPLGRIGQDAGLRERHRPARPLSFATARRCRYPRSMESKRCGTAIRFRNPSGPQPGR